MTEPIRVDIVSDVVCPWCVVGYHQLAKAARETGIDIDIHWHPFELNPQMAEDGEDLQEHLAAKYGTTPEAWRQARARLTGIGEGLGFTFDYGDDMRMWNTFRAHQLIDWADDQGRAHDVKLALFEAFFTRGEDVSNLAVLARIAAQAGLDAAAARRMLESGERADGVRALQQFWIGKGVHAVPAIVFELHHLSTGAQGEAAYARVLKQLRADRAKKPAR